MIEILVALALLKMEPALTSRQLDAGEKLENFSTQSIAYERHLELPPLTNQNANGSSKKPVSAIDYLKAMERNSLREDEVPKQKVSSFIRSVAEYPKWHWFQQHKTWLSVDQRVLQTRGNNALFQDWSPFE